MVDVTPNFRGNVGACECGHPECEAFGTLGRPWSDGSRCVKRGCPCKRCAGRWSKKSGGRSQAKASTSLGVPRSSLRPGHEESTTGPLRWEHKSGAQAKPVLTRFLLSEAQSEAARPFGDHRPFVATFEHEGRSVAVVDLNDLAEVTAALVSRFEMGAQHG